MWINLEEPNIHDGIVQSLTINIAAKKTELVSKQWNMMGQGWHVIQTLKFSGVAWQDFRDFNT